MAKVKAVNSSGLVQKRRPALTPEARENQMIALAVDLVEKRLLEGTASSQETTHFLKLATAKYRNEVEILERQKELVTAKTEALKAQKRTDEMFAEAIKAFKTYSGQNDEEEYDDDDEWD